MQYLKNDTNEIIWSETKVAQSCPTLYDPLLYSPWNSLGQTTGVGSLSLLQGVFPTQGSNPGLPHCRRILCQLSHKGSPRILEWVAYPFSSISSWPRNQTGVSCIAGGFFTNWAIREAQWTYLQNQNRIRDVDEKLLATRRESGGEINWETWIDIYMLLYIK